MVQCLSCKAYLEGVWTERLETEPHANTSQFLGILNGYFCGGPGWVSCYCSPCYRKKILQVAAGFSSENFLTEIQSLPQKHVERPNRPADPPQSRKYSHLEVSLAQKVTVLESQNADLLEEIQKLKETIKLESPKNEPEPCTRPNTEKFNEDFMGQSAIQLLNFIDDFSHSESTLLKVDRNNLTQQMNECVKSAVSKFVCSTLDELLRNLAETAISLDKEILENETVKIKTLSDIKTQISSNKDQSSRWATHRSKLNWLVSYLYYSIFLVPNKFINSLL
eukprot:Phypoly_transcript_08374.p1 GENE.Phypoly_transcript_08374~~Phypoly_transcript_08374.p1  ORF type:complete len:279 (+),score=42.23 Phypoly_transcript_08374:464-1300(+)